MSGEMADRVLSGHTSNVVSVCFALDGKTIVSGSWDHTLRLWEADTGKELALLKGHTDNVNYVCVSQDDSLLRRQHSPFVGCEFRRAAGGAPGPHKQRAIVVLQQGLQDDCVLLCRQHGESMGRSTGTAACYV